MVGRVNIENDGRENSKFKSKVCWKEILGAAMSLTINRMIKDGKIRFSDLG